MSSRKLVVIGGGAAGYFAAINAKANDPLLDVTILEKSGNVLSKVKISGGGRCNVTHACFDPKELIKFYPRGSRELLGPFSRFQPGDTFAWFAERGVELKTEDDGRVFPVSNQSQTIIDCFEREVRKHGVRVSLHTGIKSMSRKDNEWQINTLDGKTIQADDVIMATGSSPQVWELIRSLGHTIVEPVPSLFTFNIADHRLQGLAGLSSSLAEVHIDDSKFSAEGPLLVTHWGLSGPGILRLSAWAALELAKRNYQFTIRVNWDSHYSVDSLTDYLKKLRDDQPRKLVFTQSVVSIPNRLWQSLIGLYITTDKKWADLSNRNIDQIANAVCACPFLVAGKSAFKDEFVTAGGVLLKEVDFKTMQSKICPHLYFAGEVLDIDAITGGFNFQAAWTTAWIAAQLGG